MPGESPEPRQKDPNTSIDSTINVTKLSQSHKIPKRVLRKGKWVKVIEEPVEVQLTRYQDELRQGDEVIQKLKLQRERLDVQVKEIQDMVNAKIKEAKEEESKRIKRTMENIHHPNRRQFEQNLQKLTPEQVSERLRELELEYKNARKQEQFLTKELETVKEENEDRKVLDQIAHLEDAIKNIDKDFVRIAGEIKNNEKIKKDNEKRIESIQSVGDDAQEINRMTQEVFYMKEKVKTLETKQKREEEKYQDLEKLIKELYENYQDNYKKYVDKCKKAGIDAAPIKQIELDQEYQKLLDDKLAKEEWDRIAKKGKKDAPKKEEQKEPETEEEKQEREAKEKEEREKKEKEEKEKKEKEDKEKKEPKLPAYHKKLVKEIRKDQDNFEELPVSAENFIRLELNHQKLKEYRKHQLKLFAKEIKSLEDKLSDIQFEISSTQQYTREKEKEKEIADTRFTDLKKLLRKDQLESLDKSVIPKRPELEGDAKVYKDLEKKKKELLAKQATLLKNRKTEGQLPFSERVFKYNRKSSHKRLDQSIEEEQELTPLEMIKDVNFRLSTRQLYGRNPDKETQICDDVNVVGSMSIDHRIRKILFFHSAEKGLIYGFETEYLRGDGKSTVAGQWQINDGMKKDKDTKQVVLEISSDDWIDVMIGEIDGGFINYLKITTKRLKVVELGKSQGLDAEAMKDKTKAFEFRRTKGEVPITLFGGFSVNGEVVEGKEKPLVLQVYHIRQALSCLGLESAEKMRIEERIMIEAERKQLRDQKDREAREKKLQDSSVYQPLLEAEKQQAVPPKDPKTTK